MHGTADMRGASTPYGMDVCRILLLLGPCLLRQTLLRNAHCSAT